MLIAEVALGAEALQQSGPVMPVLVSGPRGAVLTRALLDMGSSMSSVALDVLQQIGAPLVGQTTIETAAGESPAGLYTAIITEKAGRVLLDGRVLGAQLDPPVQVLIGREVLAHLHFHYDGAGTWHLGEASFLAAALPVAVTAAAGLLGFWLGAHASRRRR